MKENSKKVWVLIMVKLSTMIKMKSMRDKYPMILIEMVKVNIPLLMEMFMKVNSSLMIFLELEKWNIKMEMFIKENFWEVRGMDKVGCFIHTIKAFMMDIGEMTKEMERVPK